MRRAPARNIDEMREPGWQPYVDENSLGRDPRRLWASEWHQLFPEGDGRRKLTWRGRFRPFENATNFYSSGEDVLQNGDGTNPLPSLATYDTGLRAWVTQEMAKGSQFALVLTGASHGGWGLNAGYEYIGWVPASAFELSDETLRSDSFFKRFAAPELYHPIQGSGAANNYAIRSTMLAEALPALSFATGANQLDLLQERNVDMNSLQPNGWPESRTNTNLGSRWLHSDFRAVAHYYTWQLYQKIVKEGELK